MKIFNWVHRRFHHKDEVGQVATNEVTGNGKDKLALLEHVAFDSVFDGWKEGILAIGTLGFDPALLKGSDPKEDTYFCEISPKELFVGDNGDEDDSGEQEIEMEFPLVLKACKHGFFHDQKDDHPQCDEVSKRNHREDNVEDLAGVDADEVKRERKTGERITLADLFWADSETNLLKNKRLADEDHVKVHFHTTESNKKHTSNDDRVALISKKKLLKDSTTHTIKKINRMMRKMMRKMLKKKIHPDVENQKVAARMKPMRVPGSVKTA